VGAPAFHSSRHQSALQVAVSHCMNGRGGRRKKGKERKETRRIDDINTTYFSYLRPVNVFGRLKHWASERGKKVERATGVFLIVATPSLYSVTAMGRKEGKKGKALRIGRDPLSSARHHIPEKGKRKRKRSAAGAIPK